MLALGGWLVGHVDRGLREGVEMANKDRDHRRLAVWGEELAGGWPVGGKGQWEGPQEVGWLGGRAVLGCPARKRGRSRLGWEHTDHEGTAPVLSVCPLLFSVHHSN